ncbi:helix-turn-helix domain-containing protein [Aquimarina brevivitae]|nr:helix-turn-helix domain-containing protein [Aquimarina brevivitae]
MYSLKALGKEIKKKWKLYIPASIEILVFSILFAMVYRNPEFHVLLQQQYNFFSWYYAVSSSYIVIFCFLIIVNNIKHHRALKFYFGAVKNKGLGWLTIFCSICILLNIVRQLNFILLPELAVINFLFTFFGLGSLYYISIASLMQINIDNIIPSQQQLHQNITELKRVMKTIRNHINKNKSFLKPDLNLKSFSAEINMPERVISKAINQVEGLNFNSFINTYRVREYKKLATSNRYKNYNIYAIAEEVGFNSRASFYKNFKEIVGIPPSEFQK